MKGIILAGGMGTRLAPVTVAVSKQLLPVYDKPMVYYPLSLLMLAGIRDILVITRPDEADLYRKLLGDGTQWGIRISYVAQPKPAGLPQAFTLGRDFIDGGDCALVLGDNVVYGQGLQILLDKAVRENRGATIFSYYTRDPERYGIVSFDATGRAMSVEEKPTRPKSNHAIIGLYLFDRRVTEIAANLAPSARGELEITDIIRQYLTWDELQVVPFGRGYAWFDSGTHESLMQASAFVHTIEERQGLKIACLEEIAYIMKFIDAQQLKVCAERFRNSSYGEYLNKILEA
ncbi:MAG: glucose-1-phosphate thymidylyltransferase RfbA [Alphaproteobacteria bacterium]